METPGNLPEDARKNIQEKIDDEQFKENIRKDIEENPKYDAFFAPYPQNNRKEFAKGYAFIKYMYTHFADQYETKAERKKIGMLADSKQGLAEIQYKKIFNAQCLWRAGKLDIKEVHITTDFGYWQQYALNCPFIEPISQDDVELYMKFLSSSNAEKANWIFGYGEYREIKQSVEKNEESGFYPEWYEFYDLHRGTGGLINLPDIRGEKEEFYRNLYFENQKQEQMKAGTYKEYKFVPPKPYLTTSKEEHVRKFVKTFENIAEQELYDNYMLPEKNESGLEIDGDLFLLKDAHDTIAIEANADWRQAIHKAAVRYRNILISRAMPMAFDEYCMKRAAGIGFYEKVEKQEDYFLTKIVAPQILKGREVNGEPRDFNF